MYSLREPSGVLLPIGSSLIEGQKRWICMRRCAACGQATKKGQKFCAACNRQGPNRKKCRDCGVYTDGGRALCMSCDQGHKNRKKDKQKAAPRGAEAETSTVHPHGRVKKRWKTTYRGSTAKPEDYLTKPGEAWMSTFSRNVAADQQPGVSRGEANGDT